MIGDGMGVAQISCGWVLNSGHLNLDNFPVTGLSRTYAVDKLITDSCAYGPHAQDFAGVYENAEIGRKIRRLMKSQK